MYMHLGQDMLINTKDIVGVFDLDTTTVSRITKDFLSGAEKNGEIENNLEELPKSFVVTGTKRNQKIFLSQISTTTLLKRWDFIKGIALEEAIK